MDHLAYVRHASYADRNRHSWLVHPFKTGRLACYSAVTDRFRRNRRKRGNRELARSVDRQPQQDQPFTISDAALDDSHPLRLPGSHASKYEGHSQSDGGDQPLFSERSIGTLASYGNRSEEHTSELQSRFDLVCRL